MVETNADFLRRFGQQIAAMRKKHNLTQDELAKRAGISKAYVSSIESGRRWPRISIVHAIAKALDTEINKFFENTIPEGSTKNTFAN